MNVEERLMELEREVKRLRLQMKTMRPKDGWISKIIGTAKDDPVYEEIMRIGKEIRDAEPPAE